MRPVLTTVTAAVLLPALAGLGLFSFLFSAGCGDPGVPTFQVQQRTFRRLVTAEGTLKAERTTVVTVPPEVRRSVRLAWVAADGSLVEENQVVATFDSSAMEERLAEGQSDLASASLEVDRSRAESEISLRELDTRLRVAELELDLAQRYQKTDDSVYSRHEIIESEIDEKLAGERKQHATDSQAIQQRLAKTKLELLQIRQRKAQLKIDQARDGLQALEVQAPHAGLLTLSRDWQGEPPQVGTEMWRGQEIAEIPDLSKMEAEVFVLEADAGGLEKGKPAVVVLEAHPEEEIAATIKRIDSIAKTHIRGSPVQYFGVTLELERTDSEIMKPGYRVRATLILQDLEQALVVPRQAVHRDQETDQVWVREGRRFILRPVEITASSMGLVVIGSGLEPGDVIALRQPPNGEGRRNGGVAEAAQPAAEDGEADGAR